MGSAMPTPTSRAPEVCSFGKRLFPLELPHKHLCGVTCLAQCVALQRPQKGFAHPAQELLTSSEEKTGQESRRSPVNSWVPSLLCPPPPLGCPVSSHVERFSLARETGYMPRASSETCFHLDPVPCLSVIINVYPTATLCVPSYSCSDGRPGPEGQPAWAEGRTGMEGGHSSRQGFCA